MKRALMCLLVCGTVLAKGSWGQEPVDLQASEAAIRKGAASYMEAFNKHDAKAIADQWSPDAVYLNRSTGEEVVGREAIAKQFAELFKQQPELKLEVTVTSVQFVSPNVAIETGTATLLAPGAEPDETEYSAVNVRRDGKWLLDRVTDKAKETASSHHEQLKVLEWMVGSWKTDAEDADVELECNWTKNQNFLTRAFKLEAGDDSFSGMQVIGWDPAAKTIRSWTFDSNGTFSEGTWQNRGGRWFIKNRGTLPDGRVATMTNVMKPVGEGSFTWQTIDRTAGGELQPNIDEILIVRQ
jgi:uncharacterized protein (TIGR02246 family)